MGHYDDAYSASNRDHDEMMNRNADFNLRRDFESKVPDMTTREMLLLTKIINNIDAYVNFFDIINKHAK